VEIIERRIYLIRGYKVVMDQDLARMYGVQTFNLNKAVKRNLDRFPEDFMFQLSGEEAEALRFHLGMSKPIGRGGRRYLPYAFTEQGVAMLSGILRSKRAIHVNIAIMRAFVRLRQLLETNEAFRREIEALKNRQQTQEGRIEIIFDAVEELRQLLEAPPEPKSPIGFRPTRKKAGS
jgi:hypothetical protein